MYIGYMVVKIGVQKSEDLDPIMYNPLYDPIKREECLKSVPKSMLTNGCVKQFICIALVW